MKTYQLNILAVCVMALSIISCKKNNGGREALEEGRVTFDLPATTDVVTTSLNIKEVTLISTEMKATLQGSTSSDVHYVTFAPDTTKIVDYRLKYGNSALLLPTKSYLFYKPIVAIPAGSNVSEAAVLNLSFQTTLRPLSTYVLPLTITSVDGKPQDPVKRRVVYYVFNTGEALYVDHTGYAPTATASSTAGSNAASRAIDANTGGTYWASATTAALPQWLNIDYGRNVTFSGLDYFFPTAVTPAVGGYTTSAKIETSTDNTNWTDRGTYAIDVNNAAKKQTLNLPAPATGRYVRFTILAATPYSNTFSIGFVAGILLRN
ncbi:discoidin domain-containing protein [Pedobacter helvus]|uniref:Discoidin domain-containing protein n=1 Tax=Pedobacter helvus TaxID=2563444 RepID=A0ABW9JD85_9SPHI|nr:discoidin domain-containing protein [Pedobacter ureilyticus]